MGRQLDETWDFIRKVSELGSEDIEDQLDIVGAFIRGYRLAREHFEDRAEFDARYDDQKNAELAEHAAQFRRDHKMRMRRGKESD